jgi:elongation factor P
MASILYVDVRKGMVILGEEGQLLYCIDRDLRTPGNLPSKLRLKVKNIKTGYVNEIRVHPEDKVEQVYLDKQTMQYLYKETDGYVFMDNDTFDQITLPEEMVGDLMGYLKENNNVVITWHDGKALSVEVPALVQLEVIECDPAIKGATAKDQYKPAVLETGLKITVPPFIEKGEVIEVNTSDGTYAGRVKR